ncbi:hypothetical protein [Aurantiacibacter xanthus]|uniref:hypothetical protein n=1 Tax=Aurantiacibacter xanthus TaxID=1784712 RepID=UPI0011C2108F|nr:hypothetical protein [Aurantiacibacter xanthus]
MASSFGQGSVGGNAIPLVCTGRMSAIGAGMVAGRSSARAPANATGRELGLSTGGRFLYGALSWNFPPAAKDWR